MKNFKSLLMAGVIAMAFFAVKSTSAQTVHFVTVSNFQFTPAIITIEPGDIVTWDNVDGFHNANGPTSIFPDNPESFSTGSPASAPWVESVTFSLEGTYTYQCDIHTSMVGTIVVESSTPPCENPYPTVSGLASQAQGNGFLLSWDPIDGSIGCQVQLSTGGEILGSKIIGGSNVSQFLVPGQFLNPGFTYNWSVRCGCSQSPIIAGPFASSSFVVPAIAAISSFPNPTSDVSNVSFNVATETYTTLEVFDMSGRSIHSLHDAMAFPDTDYRYTFSGADLPTGIYLYRLTTQKETVIEKFMISR